MKTKATKISMWIGIVLLAIQFLAAGLGKFFGAWTEKFTDWGYPMMLMYGIGIVELLSVIGLLFSKTRNWSVIAIIMIMAGAAYTHIVATDYSRIIHNGIVSGLAVAVLLFNKKSS